MDQPDTKVKTYAKPQEARTKNYFDPAEGWNGKEPPGLKDPPKNLIWSLIKSLSPGSSLHKTTLPVNILEPRSLLEAYADCNSFSGLLINAIKQEDPIKRMIGIVQWYLSPFRLKPNKLRKPYNPILGEVFCCSFDLREDGNLEWYSEQVSHHPPISAFCMKNNTHEFVFNGSIHMVSKYMFPISIGADSVGSATLKLKNGEVYRITYPSGFVPNILATDLQLELYGKTRIVCEKTQLNTEIEFFASKNPLFGTKIEINTVKGVIKQGKTSLYQISGKWNHNMYIQKLSNSLSTGDVSFPKEILLDDTLVDKFKTNMICRKLKDQQWYESRKLWQNLTRAIWLRNEKIAGEAKHFIEQRQRELRKRNEEGTIKLFKKKSDNKYQFTHDVKTSLTVPVSEEPAPKLKVISFTEMTK